MIFPFKHKHDKKEINKLIYFDSKKYLSLVSFNPLGFTKQPIFPIKSSIADPQGIPSGGTSLNKSNRIPKGSPEGKSTRSRHTPQIQINQQNNRKSPWVHDRISQSNASKKGYFWSTKTRKKRSDLWYITSQRLLNTPVAAITSRRRRRFCGYSFAPFSIIYGSHYSIFLYNNIDHGNRFRGGRRGKST